MVFRVVFPKMRIWKVLTGSSINMCQQPPTNEVLFSRCKAAQVKAQPQLYPMQLILNLEHRFHPNPEFRIHAKLKHRIHLKLKHRLEKSVLAERLLKCPCLPTESGLPTSLSHS